MCAVRNAPSRLLQTPTTKEKVQQYKPCARQTTVLFLQMDLVPHANAAHHPSENFFRLRVADGQDSPISGAEMLAFESGACSVTEGHRAHNVCGAERTFEAVANTNDKRKSATVQAMCKANDRPVSPNGSRTTRKCCASSF